MPPSFCDSSHTSECTPAAGFQWNFTRLVLPLALTSRNVWTPKPSMVRKARGIARSDIAHISMWVDSGVQRHEVPERVVGGLRLRDLAIGLGLRRVDHVGELDAVLDEEHGHVVADEVEVALLRVELRGEAAHVTSGVGGTA